MREADLRARLESHLGPTYSLMWSDTVVLRQVSDKIDDHAGVTMLVRGPHVVAA